MILRLHSFLIYFFALIAAALLAFAPVAAKPASQGYQRLDGTISGDPAVILLTSLESFDYHAKIAPECCNATAEATRFNKGALNVSAPVHIGGSEYFSQQWLATSALYGGNLGDNIAGSATNSIINEALALTQSKIRGVKDDWNLGEGSIPGAVLHGLAGCGASAAQDKGCAEGFVAAAGAEFTTGFLHHQNGGDTKATAEIMKLYGNPLLAALTSGGDVAQFNINHGITDSKLNNNYLNAEERKKAEGLLGELQSCLAPSSGKSIQDCRYITDKLGTLQLASANNTSAMLESCRKTPESQACGDAIVEAQAYLDWSDGFGNLRESWTPLPAI